MARPKGSKNVTVTAERRPSRCAQCDSTESEKLGDRRVQHYAGLDNDGRPYNMIVRQNVRCTACGQVRIDRSLEFDPKLEEETAAPADRVSV